MKRILKTIWAMFKAFWMPTDFDGSGAERKEGK